MTPRERFLAALHGRPVDRTPTAHVSALTTTTLQERTGCRMPEVHLQPERLATLCWANHEVLGFDAVCFLVNYFNEPAALGAPVDWGAPNRYPAVTAHPWREEADAEAPPDVLSRSPVREYLEALRIAKERYGEQVAVLGKIMGPLSMTQALHGVENVLVDLIEAPDRIRRFLDVAADVLVRCANAQFDLGVDAVAIGEGGAGANMLSPAMHEEFLQPVHRAMVERLHGPAVMHICGDITPRLSSLAASGITCFNFDWAIEPAVMKQAAAGRFTIMGNVSTTLLRTGTPEAVRAASRACIEAGVDILSPGCAVSPDCPDENLRALATA